MKRIHLVYGDITTQKVDAIVNAANTSLLGGGGVDGAIHRKGGEQILAECQKIRNKQGGCAVGEAVITTAGLLPSHYVIHTVGPIWQDGQANEDQLLKKAYLNSLKLAEKYQLSNIAFPNISTGVYHFPKVQASEISIETVLEFLEYNQYLQDIYFVCFDKENFQIYQHLLSQIQTDKIQVLGL
ncbi:O-acetyl-ADP-ribose deacetylase [Acinetobacter stercoris]|uniref:O-acetyl-ADP-ribose deacetylase n=1 Tax=Acinetobacter stercoris TaxID=2126983 RepID=A0A2U3MY88_9GAMM|nr:O-acetyl-ADP-ribose deacetylase [Acinetobacter stercoris]SPL70408.1 O-acetyl-ADP-ribose deacetylase [Acinetobacter stercoris]